MGYKSIYLQRWWRGLGAKEGDAVVGLKFKFLLFSWLGQFLDDNQAIVIAIAKMMMSKRGWCRGPKISLENSSEDPVSGSWSLFVLPPKCNRAGCSKKQRGVWSGGIEARIELVDRQRCYGQCRFYHYWDQQTAVYRRTVHNIAHWLISQYLLVCLTVKEVGQG